MNGKGELGLGVSWTTLSIASGMGCANLTFKPAVVKSGVCFATWFAMTACAVMYGDLRERGSSLGSSTVRKISAPGLASVFFLPSAIMVTGRVTTSATIGSVVSRKNLSMRISE